MLGSVVMTTGDSPNSFSVTTRAGWPGGIGRGGRER